MPECGLNGMDISGWFPEKAAEWAVPYASIALALDQPCPVLDSESERASNKLDAFKHKEGWACWQALHKGEVSTGKRHVFGQLVNRGADIIWGVLGICSPCHPPFCCLFLLPVPTCVVDDIAFEGIDL